jgi:integrase
LLRTVKQRDPDDMVYPMMAFAAHTGARRSEMRRCTVDDVDLETEIVTIHERKRVRGRLGHVVQCRHGHRNDRRFPSLWQAGFAFQEPPSKSNSAFLMKDPPFFLIATPSPYCQNGRLLNPP